jgi:DNA-binding transcriptional LysR family regulator
MDLRYLRTFDTVAALLSFHRAAEVLHCTQSTVSAQIKTLEEDLGRPLFERLGRRVVLTQAGVELQRRAKSILEQEKEAYAAVRGNCETVTTLSIRVPQSVAATYLPDILCRFHQQWPKVGFDISNCAYHELADELSTGKTDVAFLLAETLGVASVEEVVLGVEPLVFVTHPDSELRHLAAFSLAALEGKTLLLPKHDCGYRMGLEASLRANRVHLATLIELNCVSTMVRCLTRGLGIGLLPAIAVRREVDSGQLCVLSTIEPRSTNLLLLRHRDRDITGTFAAFLECVRARFAIV